MLSSTSHDLHHYKEFAELFHIFAGLFQDPFFCQTANLSLILHVFISEGNEIITFSSSDINLHTEEM